MQKLYTGMKIDPLLEEGMKKMEMAENERFMERVSHPSHWGPAENTLSSDKIDP